MKSIGTNEKALVLIIKIHKSKRKSTGFIAKSIGTNEKALVLLRNSE